MKKFYFLLAFSIFLINLDAQVQWAHKGGKYAYDYGYGVVTDNAGNVYVAGKFEENAIFDTETANCQGNHDAFIAKYNQSGTIQWLRTAGGADGDYAWGITTDGANYFYIAGEVEGTTPIIFSGSNITIQGTGDNDIFVAKYDLNGNVLWAKREGVGTSEKALCVSHDPSGNVYIAGYFTDNSNFNGSAVTGFGGRDIFVAKYDATGAFQWVQKAGSTGRDEAKGIKVDNNGNVYICGMFSNNATFGNTTMTTQDNFQDSYVAKLSAADGSWQWVKKGNAVLDDVAWSLAIDNSGSIYTTGEFNSYITFENAGQGLATTGNTNIYVAKLDASGNVQWIKGAGGSAIDRSRGIGTDGTNIFITGQFGLTAQFGSTSLTAADSSDIFVAGLDAGGNFQWVNAGTGPADTFEPLGYESGIAVTGKSGMVYATGGMLRDTTLGNLVSADFGGIALNGYTRDDMFIVAMGQSSIPVAIIENAPLADMNVFPNPAKDKFMINLANVSGNVEMSIYNTMGQRVLSGNYTAGALLDVDLTGNAEGIYVAEIVTDKNEVLRHKIILNK